MTYLHGGWAQLTDAVRGLGPWGAPPAGSATGVEHDPKDPFGPTVHTTTGVLRARQVVVAAGSPPRVAALLPDGAPRRGPRSGRP